MNNASVVMVRVGGEDFPYRTEAACKTCASPHRLWIEREIVRTRSYAAIARDLAAMDEDDPPDARALARHVKNGHLPAPAQARAALVQRRAEQMGANLIDAESLINEVVVADLVLHQGAEMIATGQIKPTVAETLMAARLLRDFNAEADTNFDLEALTESVMRFYELVQKYMSVEDFQAFIVETQRDPILRAIRAKQEARTLAIAGGEEPIDVEYTESG